MAKKGYKIAAEVKEQILKRIKDEGVSVNQAANDAGVHESTIYGWLGTGAEGAPSWGDMTKLRKQNRELLELVGELPLTLSVSKKKS